MENKEEYEQVSIETIDSEMTKTQKNLTKLFEVYFKTNGYMQKIVEKMIDVSNYSMVDKDLLEKYITSDNDEYKDEVSQLIVFNMMDKTKAADWMEKFNHFGEIRKLKENCDYYAKVYYDHVGDTWEDPNNERNYDNAYDKLKEAQLQIEDIPFKKEFSLDRRSL